MSLLAQNILTQAQSLLGVLDQQTDDGAPALAEAATLLRSGRPVLITGMGASLFAAIPLAYTLCSQGIDAVAIEAGELLHYRAPAFRDAIALIVSRSGESVEIAKLLELLKGRQPTIGISNVPGSLLARSADVPIHIGSLADEIVAIQSYSGTLATLALLAAATRNALAPTRDTLHHAIPELARLTDEQLAAREKWDAFLAGRHPIYLLGRGPSYASALEGALLFHEIAKSPAVAMPAASFRHGPVEVTDRSFRGFVFAPEGKTRDLNLALAHDLASFGGQLHVLGPNPGDPSSLFPTDPLPSLPEALAPLFEIVPVQVAALRLAELRGIRPGSFRFAPQVSTNESSFPPANTSK